jgi:arsenate reductase (thioredoxin)
MPPHYNVLFLCTGNSARSIMAEGILNGKRDPHFTAFSAGSMPSGHVRPEALHQLELASLPTESARSKSWNGFATPDAPKMDFVFTVCDQAAKEPCPFWPDQPIMAHWGVHDPAAATGSSVEIERAFRDAFLTLSRRINLCLSLPLESLDQLTIKSALEKIGNE